MEYKIEQIGPYKLVGVIYVGKGEMRTIYKANHPELKRMFAVKVLEDDSEEPVQRFTEEARILSMLDHPNLVPIVDFAHDKNRYFIVREYVDGTSLQAISEGFPGALPIQHSIYVAISVLWGLHEAHTKKDFNNKPLKIIHRNISPEHVLISHQGEVKLIGFGGAKSAMSREQTRPGVFWGDPLAASPERAAGNTMVDARSDLFSVGTILYSMITGKMPFWGKPLDVLKQIENAKIHPPSSQNWEIDKSLDAIILKAMSRLPQDRFQSAAEFAEHLHKYLLGRYPRYHPRELTALLRPSLSESNEKNSVGESKQRNPTPRVNRPDRTSAPQLSTEHQLAPQIPLDEKQKIHVAPPDLAVGVGFVVGSFRLEKLLGQGGFGEVWRATHPMIGSQVAIKIIHHKYKADQETLHRFQAEAIAVNKIKHPNIAQISDFGYLTDGRPYFIMEYLEGEPLSSYIKLRGSLPFSEIFGIFEQLCSVLQAAHQQNIVHRDVKPQNIFLLKKEAPSKPRPLKLLDFGLAKFQVSQFSLLEAKGPLTPQGILVGTWDYASPEQCKGKDIGPASDLYSLGIILFELLTGQRPFTSANEFALMNKHLIQPPPSLSQVAPARTFPAALEELLQRALSKTPQERHPNAKAMLQHLSQALGKALDCSSCGQHMYSCESVCPFCGAVPKRGSALWERAASLLSRVGGAFVSSAQEHPKPPPVPPTEKTTVTVKKDLCIGCEICVENCPNDVLGIDHGTRTSIVVHPDRCRGTFHCTKACPTGAMVVIKGGKIPEATEPLLNDHHESNVPGLYVVGMRSGRTLIKHAILEGKEATEHIAASLDTFWSYPKTGTYDVIIVGAGPGGLSAALVAKELGLRYLLLEKELYIADTIRRFPAGAIVSAGPAHLPAEPLWMETTTKEVLLHRWSEIIQRTKLNLKTECEVVGVSVDQAVYIDTESGERPSERCFFVETSVGKTFQSRRLIMANGWSGQPNRIGCPGEDKEAARVLYRIDNPQTASYQGESCLVLGCGDSAVEAVLSLVEAGAVVTFACRRDKLDRVREKLLVRLREYLKQKKLTLYLSGTCKEIKQGVVVIKHEKGTCKVKGDTFVSNGKAGEDEIKNDYVFALLGSQPREIFLKKCGVQMKKVTLV